VSATIISDPLRVPVAARRLDDGRILIHTPGKPTLIFSVSEIDRLSEFAHDDEPQLGRLERFPTRRAPN
jgi:hypothetical protein